MQGATCGNTDSRGTIFPSSACPQGMNSLLNRQVATQAPNDLIEGMTVQQAATKCCKPEGVSILAMGGCYSEGTQVVILCRLSCDEPSNYQA